MTSPETMRRRVPSHGPEFQQAIDLKRHDRAQGIDFFGADLLRSAQYRKESGPYWDQLVKKSGGEVIARLAAGRSTRRYERFLATARQDLFTLLERDKSEPLFRNTVQSFFETAPDFESFIKQYRLGDYDDPADRAEFDAIVDQAMLDTTESRDVVQRRLMMNEMLESISSQSYDEECQNLSEEFIIALIEHHATECQTRLAALEAELPHDLTVVQEAIQKKIASGELPWQSDTVVQRLAHIQIKGHDPLLSSLQDTWGQYSPKEHTIYISLLVPPQNRVHVMAHEVNHALGGQLAFLEAFDEDSWNDPEMARLNVVKSGLRFNRLNEKSVTSHDFLIWLDEAVAEESAMNIVDAQASGHYSIERQLLAKFIDNGIDKQLFYKAYNESSPVSDLTEGSRLPATRDLFQAINKRFYPGFLMNLDRAIQSRITSDDRTIKGRSEAAKYFLQKWNELNEAFPTWLKEEAVRIKNPTTSAKLPSKKRKSIS